MEAQWVSLGRRDAKLQSIKLLDVPSSGIQTKAAHSQCMVGQMADFFFFLQSYKFDSM